MSQVHAQARTTPRTRGEIKEPSASLVALAERYNISLATARKWKGRECPQDLSHRPLKLSTTLSPAQETIAVELRCVTLLPLDDLVAVVREFINPDISRSGLDRCLRRHGVANLRDLQAKALADAAEAQAPIKTFKDNEPASCTWTSNTCRRCPASASAATCSWPSTAQPAGCSCASTPIKAKQQRGLLSRLERTAPMKIIKLLPDNGSQFTDRFTSTKREPTGNHKFDVRCKALNIEHGLCPPRHPQTNGMVERFNGRISEVVNQTRFASAAELETTLDSYLKTYNHLIPQRALNHLSPVQP